MRAACPRSSSLRHAGPCRPRGLTLVELAVTLLLAAVLAVLGAPLGIRWVDGTKVTQTQTMLQHGFSVTKSLALQNPAQATQSAVAAKLCVTSTALAVYQGDVACGSAGALWQSTIPSGVTVSFGSGAGAVSAPTCVALTNTGAPVAGASPCQLSLVYSITKGLSSVSGKTLY